MAMKQQKMDSALPIDSAKRYEDSLRRTSAPVYASQLPQQKMDLLGLSRYARDKGVSVLDLAVEEKSLYGVISPDAEEKGNVQVQIP